LRVAIAGDPHILDRSLRVEDEKGTPTVAKEARESINAVGADVLFVLGDLVSESHPDPWRGYKKWVEGINAPVLDLLGGHDREHFSGQSYGTEYFTLLGRVSGTRAYRMGNNLFVLLSEEHSPSNVGNLGSTVNERQIRFLDRVLSSFSGNAFLMQHTPLYNTVAYSGGEWYYTGNPNWKHVSKKMKELLDRHGVTAHISGHIHTKYSWRDYPGDPRNGTAGVENVGKIVRGKDINEDPREYPPFELPDSYFLNLPVVAYPHYQWHFDTGAIYYFDVEEGSRYIDIVTRDFKRDEDVETNRVELDEEISLGDRRMRLVDSMLSLRKKGRLKIQRDGWFTVPAKGLGVGEFSKVWPEKTDVERVWLDAEGGEISHVEYQGSDDHGETWSDWTDEPPRGVNAVKVRIGFSPTREKMIVRDIALKRPLLQRPIVQAGIVAGGIGAGLVITKAMDWW